MRFQKINPFDNDLPHDMMMFLVHQLERYGITKTIKLYGKDIIHTMLVRHHPSRLKYFDVKDRKFLTELMQALGIDTSIPTMI